MRASTEEAARRKNFGAPILFAGKGMFWGNDHLEDALRWAVEPALPPAA